MTYQETQLHNTAVALGKFQGLHRGHLLLINQIVDLAKTECLASVVFTINVKNSKMINDQRDRVSILKDLDVDYQIDCEFTKEFASMKPYEFIKKVLSQKLGAKYIVIGTDFCFGNNREGNVDTLLQYQEEFGYKVLPIEKYSIEGNVVSSSSIREFIQQGDMKNVSLYMGRNYFIQGRVVEGKKLGRTIGFPTVNLFPPENKLLPPYGVYETRIMIDGRYYQGITNVGDNPTISDDNSTTVETHILEYNGDLYGRDLRIEFIKYIREQKKFNDVKELHQQLLLDKAYVMHQ